MKRTISTAALFLLVSLGSPLVAATIVVDPNPPALAAGIRDQATGADLAGLVVTATYETPGSPTSVSAIWASTGPNSGSATGQGGLSVSVSGDASAPLAWNYSSQFLSLLTSLELDGTAAGIYFDRAHSGSGTPGSGQGADLAFGPLLGSSDAITITYSSAVSSNGQPPQNDLYAKVLIDFSGLPQGGLIPQDFAFSQPTDLNVAPEPEAWITLLMTAGLMGLARINQVRKLRVR
jgi:hypothetical protein